MTGIITMQRLSRNIDFNKSDMMNTTYNQLICEQIYKENMRLQDKTLLYCPPYHDGATCWPPILAGTKAQMPCPSSYEGQMYNPNENASKECLENGNWSSKSNYIPCLLTRDSSTLDLTMVLRCIFLTGYSLSCACLCLALIIFYIFKSLKCMRNTIHSHLFVALMIKACAWSISYIFVEFTDINQFKDDTKLTINNLLNITISLQAFGSLAIFVWMFIEGLYLCLIVYYAFWVEKMKFWPYALLGWGLPTILITIRTIMNYIRHPTEFWLFYGTDVYLITIPALILLGLNVIFLIIILYALNDKLRKRDITTNIDANIHSNNNNNNNNNDVTYDTEFQKQNHPISPNDPYENYSNIVNYTTNIQPLVTITNHRTNFISLSNKQNNYYCNSLKQRKFLSFHIKSKSNLNQDTTNNDKNEQNISSIIPTNNVSLDMNQDTTYNNDEQNNSSITNTNNIFLDMNQDTTNKENELNNSSIIPTNNLSLDMNQNTTNKKNEQNNSSIINTNNNNLTKINGSYITQYKRRFQSLPNTNLSLLTDLSNDDQHRFFHKFSRNTSYRSSQISDISRFELPGTTRVRLAKLIGRISGREFVKTVKASLTLMPLLGIPEIIFITPYHPYLKPGFDIINAFLTSTQGIWVTLLYCFLTKEVRRQFRKQLKTRTLRTSLHPHRRSARMNKRQSS
ncbi:unnamed protein product [Schistosoma rodhaini]|uniref:G-protein coupled receptors family 2 profile 2 domain-containing protein n=1 Tax=Schistosoma rodhaini TaxID=6188 RepID=A0AA85GIC7_9TREM|nr:unnamed protein product [Schistosoma rodhaini]